jgi:hypothetical protein
MRKWYVAFGGAMAAALLAAIVLFTPQTEDKKMSAPDDIKFTFTETGQRPTAEDLAGEPFYQYVIYKHPKDYPQGYVVRRWRVLRNMKVLREGVIATVATLEEARKAIPANATTCVQRSPHDDPAIFETWM